MNLQDFTNATAMYSSQLLSHAIKFTNDEDDAKDLLKDTLIKGIRFCDKFHKGTNLKGWLYIIMKNTFYNNCIKTRRKKEIISDEDLSSPN
jgi:DNA-directed RNA polymerase specialized sigma24 family protein